MIFCGEYIFRHRSRFFSTVKVSRTDDVEIDERYWQCQIPNFIFGLDFLLLASKIG